MTVYNQIVNSFKENPRDVCTVPTRAKEPVWFYVFSKGSSVWVSIARNHANSSSLAMERPLSERECDVMLDIYHRRQAGEHVSREAVATTQNSVYWYGIFADLGM